MIEVYEIAYFAISVIFSAFYSGSEAALVSIPLDRAKQLIEEGGKKGKALDFMAKHPSEVLTTILVGNNIVNIFAASLTTAIAERYFDNEAIAYSVGFTTIVILIFGEIIPKTFARTHSETLAYPILKILQINYYVMFPVIVFFTWIIKSILGDHAYLRGRIVTKNDIEFMVNKAEEEKTMDSKQLNLLTSILEFPTIKVKDVMIPRNNVVYVKNDMEYLEILDLINKDNYSRYPVCDGDLDNVTGFLHVKDLAFYELYRKQESFNIQKVLKEPVFVYEHMKIQAVFDHLNKKKVHLALVKDENGIVVGIITLEDIIEEIFGEIQDEHDEEEHDIPSEVKLAQGVLVSGQISLRDLGHEYDVKIPLNENYSTLAGFLLDMLGNNFPKKGNLIIWEGYSFELMVVENYEIKSVRIKDLEGDHLYSRKSGTDETREKNGEGRKVSS